MLAARGARGRWADVNSVDMVMKLHQTRMVIALTFLPIALASEQVARPSDGHTVGVVRSVAPRFPTLAAEARISYFRFEVDVCVGSDGTPTEVHMRTPLLLFQPAVEAAARLWRFAPDAAGPERAATVMFGFRLMPRGTPESEVTAVFITPNEIEVRMFESAPISVPLG